MPTPNFVNSLKNPSRQAEILSAVRVVAESGVYSNGMMTFKLERMFAKHHGRQAVALNSAASALYTLFRYYRSQGHTHVAVPNNSFVTIGSMALATGMDVYLVDSSPECPSMGAESLKTVLDNHRQITLVVLSHVGGWVAKDYDSIAEVCSERGLTLVEDCTHALGVDAGILSPGKLSEASVWGFQSYGAVPVGDGGLLVTTDLDLRDFSKRFRQCGRYKDEHGQTKYAEGMNFSLSEWTAAIALVQMEHLPDILAARQKDADTLQSIAPCLLHGPSNFSKFPVHPHHANLRHTTPGVYALEEQLAFSLPKNPHTHLPVNLVHSTRWAQNHRCLPLGEGLYADMSESQVVALLKAA